MPVKVLLIDDSVTIHRVIDLSIDLDKFEVTKVFSKKEAEPKLASTSYSYILLDNKLENVQIFEYIKELKTQYPNTNIILLVGAFDKFGEQDLKHSMADDYLVKPFDSQSLNMKLSSIKLGAENSGSISEGKSSYDISPEINQDEKNITENISDVEPISNDIEINIDNIDGIILDAKEIDGTFDNINSDDNIDDAKVEEFNDVDIEPTDKFDINEFKVDSDAIAGIIHNWDSASSAIQTLADGEQIFDESDINNEFNFDEIISGSDIEDDEDIVKINDDELFSESKKLINDAKEDRSEFDKIASGLDINFIEDEGALKKEDAAKKDEILKSGLSYLELDDDINTVSKPYKKQDEAIAPEQDTVHKELAGSVLYDQVIVPSLSDVIDVATTPITKGRSLLVEDISTVMTDSKDKMIHSGVADKILGDDRVKSEISSAIERAISKEFLDNKFNDVLSKSLREAIEEIVPRLAEKYIIEEINRLKEDE